MANYLFLASLINYITMKKFLLLTTFLLALCNCSNDLEFNTQAFQAIKDNVLWKAPNFNAQINEDGTLKIVASFNDEVLILNVSGSAEATYELGIDSPSSATYTTSNSPVFSTLNRGNGQIVVQNYNVIEQTISGTFGFNTFSANGDVVNFINGVFFKVPIVDVVNIDIEGELRASVDDVELVADDVISTKGGGIIEIQGIAADGSFIKIFLPETITIGSYNLNEQSASGTYAIYGYANGVTSVAQFGTLFISEHDILSSKIKGSFVFTTLLPNSVSVENGSFIAFY